MSKKVKHELRDVVHTFIHFSDDEKKVINSPFFQRLRHIKQLAMTDLVYPGATHSRFEHSIGVMELAGRVFDTLFRYENRHSESCEPFRKKLDNDELQGSWRRHLRMAALLHDIGHSPFSHATESLFPNGEDHETMTRRIILDSELTKLLNSGCDIPFNPKLVAKLAVGAKHFGDDPLDTWELLLNEIITGDAFGVDRMDYLLRDSHHSGVVAGRFDHDRLIQSLRILKCVDDSQHREIAIGIEHGGIHPTEALLVARYFMYMQVYYHRVSNAYNIHCCRFANAFLQSQNVDSWPIDPNRFIDFTDNDLLAGVGKAAKNKSAAGHLDARRIQERNHFKIANEFDYNHKYLFASEKMINDLRARLESEFDAADYHLQLGNYKQGQYAPALAGSFSIWNRKVEPDKIEDSRLFSRILHKLVKPSSDYVIVDRERLNEIKACVEQFLDDNKKTMESMNDPR